MKGVSCSDEPTETSHRNLQLSSALSSLGSLFSCQAHTFTVLGHSHHSRTVVFGRKKALTIQCTPRAKRQTADKHRLASEHGEAFSS